MSRRSIAIEHNSTLAFRLLSLIAAGAIIWSACGDSNDADDPTPVPTPSPAATADPNCASPVPEGGGNALQNGGFEDGSEPWYSLATQNWGRPFVVSQSQVRSGTSSAYLQLRSADGGATRVYGVVQELGPGELPETLSGYYYVGDWQQGTPKQYLQFVVIVTGASNLPDEVRRLSANNYQIRYILAGVDAPPTNIANSRYVMVSDDAPAVGQWVRFERNVRQDFCDLWGNLPAGYNTVRVLFETRWDEREDSDAPSSADVYYDDLYWGPADGAP